MASLSLFKLEKLKIKVYEKPERSVPIDTFEVMFNPESYSASFRNVFAKKEAVGASGQEAKYALSRNSRMSFKFIFDGTGVSDYGSLPLLKGKNDVYSRVKKFLELTTTISGKIHEPYYLIIAWGHLNFKCRLEDVQVSYTLFDESGIPLRAELDTNFVRDIETSERLKEDDLNSPNLTHKRIVKAYDTLPIMCREIYGSESYYLKVAKANRLDDFRNLKPGQELFFPPIEK